MNVISSTEAAVFFFPILLFYWSAHLYILAIYLCAHTFYCICIIQSCRCQLSEFRIIFNELFSLLFTQTFCIYIVCFFNFQSSCAHAKQTQLISFRTLCVYECYLSNYRFILRINTRRLYWYIKRNNVTMTTSKNKHTEKIMISMKNFAHIYIKSFPRLCVLKLACEENKTIVCIWMRHMYGTYVYIPSTAYYIMLLTTHVEMNTLIRTLLISVPYSTSLYMYYISLPIYTFTDSTFI